MEIHVTATLSSLLLLSVCFMTASCSVSQADLELLILLCLPKSERLCYWHAPLLPALLSHNHPIAWSHFLTSLPSYLISLLVFSACLTVCATSAYSTLRGQGGVRSARNGLIDSCELSCRCWERFSERAVSALTYQAISPAWVNELPRCFPIVVLDGHIRSFVLFVLVILTLGTYSRVYL